MMFNAGAALLDTIVLSVIERKAEGIYGYKMIQDIRLVLDVPEATLYLTLHDYKEMIVYNSMMKNKKGEIESIIKLQR